MADIPAMLAAIRAQANLSQAQLAQVLGASFVSVNRWERGASRPGPAQATRIAQLYQTVLAAPDAALPPARADTAFASRGIRRRPETLPMFQALQPVVELADSPSPPILDRVTQGRWFAVDDGYALASLLADHAQPAVTVAEPLAALVSAGKNTYTYDAHTYHTKVPPQGIAELLRYYLPGGGLVFDPFAGSGMTGVAARANGYDSILNDLAPAACFIAGRFVSRVDPALFAAGVAAVLRAVQAVRAALYTTTCRECGTATELLYTVWSYRVLCPNCAHEFPLWDVCRSYGRTVREHTILKQFPCPACGRVLDKSRLQRTVAEPVQVGYKCCRRGQQEVMHPPNAQDLELIRALEAAPPLAEEFYPRDPLPAGVNLRQPRRHGLDRVDRFYTARNLAAMSHLWRAVHRVADPSLAAHLAFVVTSLYQRVTRLSEFRFWGGSGNTARFNVPFLFNEANVFVTFARKAAAIQDHLESTATHYRGQAAVIQHSATALDYLPDESVDLIFTDPPFGGNINYSEMNFLWESWLGRFTMTPDEAIINKVQGKGVAEYQQLMAQSMRECFRVLRRGHWMLLVFMNSSKAVWESLRSAIIEAGFEIRQANIFDKQHGTFKQFVSANTAGCDLVLHCWKPDTAACSAARPAAASVEDSIRAFLARTGVAQRTTVYLHVARPAEPDFRSLYSEWLGTTIVSDGTPVDFAYFRTVVESWLAAPQVP